MNLLDKLRKAGIKVWLDPHGINYDGPAEILTDEILAKMKQDKKALLLALIREKVVEYPPEAERRDERPYFGPASRALLAQHMGNCHQKPTIYKGGL